MGRNLTRHEQRELTCRVVQYDRQKYSLFYETRASVSFVMSKFHLVSQQKTRNFAVVFDVALALRPIRNNTFEIN